jgi:hypothetical protein
MAREPQLRQGHKRHLLARLLFVTLSVSSIGAIANSYRFGPPITSMNVSCARTWPRDRMSGASSDAIILSGTSFRWGGVTFKLLGLSEVADGRVRELAKEFIRQWLDSADTCIQICNAGNPLELGDRTAIIWVRGLQVGLPCLNEQLVQAGLVELDESSWSDYAFDMPIGGRPEQVDWKGILRGAIEARGRGEKPAVHFDWPPKFDFNRAA